MPKRRRPASSSSANGNGQENFVAENVPQVHHTLLEHVLANGAKLSKVKIAKLPHGMGIIASDRIRPNEEITSIPKRLLVNLHDIRFPNSSPLAHPTKAHSSLAAYIASQKNNPKNKNDNPFISILPTPQSFKTSMPMFWSDEVLSHCSPWVRSFAEKQRSKLQDDYEYAVKTHVENGQVKFEREEFEWAWAIVNTRTIYYRPKKWYRIPAEDCMTLCPFIDYYNHDWRNEESCSVGFSTDGLTVTTQKSYAPGEEIFVTYGEYNNDSLLVEYGFALPNNGSDSVSIDFWVLQRLPQRHREILQDMSFHGYDFTFSAGLIYSGLDLMISNGGDDGSKYFLNADEACYRTMTALRLAVIPERNLSIGNRKGGKRYLDFVKLVEGEMEEDDYVEKYPKDEEKVKGLLEEIVKEVKESAEENMEKLKSMLEDEKYTGEKDSISSAIERWMQTKDIITRYENKDTPS
ncbi:hypothetical protein AA313_de0210025 [Arthrobotrys entomopaga]|nr:hypothetical protein AA313_de0210025 [Arthrobotrys entomopaga]